MILSFCSGKCSNRSGHRESSEGPYSRRGDHDHAVNRGQGQRGTPMGPINPLLLSPPNAPHSWNLTTRNDDTGEGEVTRSTFMVQGQGNENKADSATTSPGHEEEEESAHEGGDDMVDSGNSVDKDKDKQSEQGDEEGGEQIESET